jgi:hypothetical protein
MAFAPPRLLIIVAFHVCCISTPALELPALLIPSVNNMQMAVHLFFIISILPAAFLRGGAPLPGLDGLLWRKAILSNRSSILRYAGL